MYRYSKDGISVMAIVDRRRKKNNGLYPVKIELVYKRVQKYYPTGQDVSQQEWETFQKPRYKSAKLASIENSFYLIEDSVKQLAERGEFSFQRLNARLGRSMDIINKVMEGKMKFLMAQGKINSYYRYRSTLHALERFGGKNILFDDITSHWLKQCELCWIKDGMGPTTINIYMKTLLCIYNEAVSEGLVREGQNPFGRNGYKIPPSSSRKLALTKEQVELISRWTGDAEIEYWRDLWMFSYLCNGINFCDMLFLKYSNIHDGEVVFVRSKTSKVLGMSRMIHAPLTPLMRKIMERSGNGAQGDSDRYIFRHAKGGETPLEASLLIRKVIGLCNSAMKVLAADLNIPAFTTYAARHSFATVLKKSGTDISFISESLGHSSIMMTQRYLAGYDKEERLRHAGNLL